MNTKRVLFVLLSGFLVYVTYGNILNMINHDTSNFWKAFVFGIYCTFCMTGIFAFSGFVLPTYKLLPEQYYRIKNPALLGGICNFLLVPYFSKSVVFLFYNKGKIKNRYFNGAEEGVHAFHNQTKQDEFGHVVPFLLLSVFCIYLILVQKYFFLIGIMTSNILLNLYPVLMQRHHRIYRKKIN